MSGSSPSPSRWVRETLARQLCLGRSTVATSAAGHDVLWAGDWPEDPGDEEILDRANQEGRILVTLDKDFGELAVVKGVPHHGILRVVNIAARQQAVVCDQVVARYGDELLAGAIVTADGGRVRIRPASPPQDDE